ncbi:MAG: phosphoglycerate kinase, partial [Pseudomonadota bacterium]
QTVLLRLDLNVPMDGEGKITDDTRLIACLPTIQTLQERGARIVILSHLGRPKGEPQPLFSLEPVAKALAHALDQKVSFVPDSYGEMAQSAAQSLKRGEILMLENLRFHSGEKANAPEFIDALAQLGDVFVNDAFSAAHRSHASITGLAGVMPSAAGLLMQREIEALTSALETPQRPVVAVVGGAKISTKLPILENMLEKIDTMLIGGAMAHTFLLAGGGQIGKVGELEIGKSLVEPNMVKQAHSLMEKAAAQGKTIALPIDGLMAKEFAAGAVHETKSVTQIASDEMMLDLGPETAAHYCEILSVAKTVVWNGPLGAFEIPPFDQCTSEVAQHVAALTQNGQVTSIAGGGDTAAALKHAGAFEQFSWVSTAGGAFLEWLEGKSLPGVSALYGEKGETRLSA